jgi:hypothetical protein
LIFIANVKVLAQEDGGRHDKLAMTIPLVFSENAKLKTDPDHFPSFLCGCLGLVSLPIQLLLLFRVFNLKFLLETAK